MPASVSRAVKLCGTEQVDPPMRTLARRPAVRRVRQRRPTLCPLRRRRGDLRAIAFLVRDENWGTFTPDAREPRRSTSAPTGSPSPIAAPAPTRTRELVYDAQDHRQGRRLALLRGGRRAEDRRADQPHRLHRAASGRRRRRPAREGPACRRARGGLALSRRSSTRCAPSRTSARFRMRSRPAPGRPAPWKATPSRWRTSATGPTPPTRPMSARWRGPGPTRCRRARRSRRRSGSPSPARCRRARGAASRSRSESPSAAPSGTLPAHRPWRPRRGGRGMRSTTGELVRRSRRDGWFARSTSAAGHGQERARALPRASARLTGADIALEIITHGSMDPFGELKPLAEAVAAAGLDPSAVARLPGAGPEIGAARRALADDAELRGDLRPPRARPFPASGSAAAWPPISPSSTASARRPTVSTTSPTPPARMSTPPMTSRSWRPWRRSLPDPLDPRLHGRGSLPHRPEPARLPRERLRQVHRAEPRQRPRLPQPHRPAPARPLQRRLDARLYRRLRPRRHRGGRARRADRPVRPHLPAAPTSRSPTSTACAKAAVYPAFHVLAGLAPLSGQALLATEVSRKGAVEALAVRDGGGTVLWLANLTAQSPRRRRFPRLPARAPSVIDATGFEELTSEPDYLDSRPRACRRPAHASTPTPWPGSSTRQRKGLRLHPLIPAHHRRRQSNGATDRRHPPTCQDGALCIWVPAYAGIDRSASVQAGQRQRGRREVASGASGIADFAGSAGDGNLYAACVRLWRRAVLE